MKRFNLNTIEAELKKRWELPYQWGRKQNDLWDRYSNFIYETEEWEDLETKSFKVSREQKLPQNEFLNYTANRWYNFNSAMAVEQIFSIMPGVKPSWERKNRLVDFTLCGINFDHKTSIYPLNFIKDIEIAKKNPRELIKWLYENQSTQSRQHFSNRLFLIVYSVGGEHWKIKAEIQWLQEILRHYVSTFNPDRLNKFEFNPGKETFSDIIWAIK